MVEAALPLAAPVKRNRSDRIKRQIARERRCHVAGNRIGKRFDAGVFVKVNQVAQSAFVLAVAIGIVKAAHAATAERAPPVQIEGKLVLERSAAAYAVKLGLEGLGLGEATGTNRNAGNLLEGNPAKAAIGGVKKGKKGVGGCSYC